MAKGTREIRRKIKSVKSTKQITKAMELVAASKMRRAVANTLALRPYARLAEALLRNLAKAVSPNKDGEAQESQPVEILHPLLAQRPVKEVLVVVISTDRGLCGGLNTQLFRKLTEYLKVEEAQKSGVKFSFIAVGKKAQDFCRRMNVKVIGAYAALSNHPKLQDTYPISRMILNDFGNGTYDKIMLVYTDFISAISQKASIRRILPLSKPALEEMVEAIESSTAKHSTNEAANESQMQTAEYLFEPSPTKVLEMLLPRLTEMQVYQAVLESTASEHAARMFAMRNASDNASDMISDLTLSYNQIRQAAITAELAEISAGRAALG